LQEEIIMKNAERSAYLVFLIVVIVGALVALAGSQGGSVVAGVPIFAVLVGLAFLIQWLVFIPSFLQQTEHFYDLTGSLTYLSITTLALILTPGTDARSFLLFSMVIIWALRLGTFLFRRIQKAGKDDRFDEIKPNFMRFLNAWTLQALWITLTSSAALIAITSATRKSIDIFAVIGLLVWLFGFGFEVTADAQKSRFNADPANKGKFINSGLWSKSRHPNYFGEIVLWIGVLIIALPVLRGWQWVALISPVFVTLLLTRVSGVPMLEKKADKKWGGQADYEEYKRRTPVLIPRL
jgi:steroid 5-alpha reductase family enzyme